MRCLTGKQDAYPTVHSNVSGKAIAADFKRICQLTGAPILWRILLEIPAAD